MNEAIMSFCVFASGKNRSLTTSFATLWDVNDGPQAMSAYLPNEGSKTNLVTFAG